MNERELDVNPSKVLIADVRMEGDIISVIVAHLISKRGSNDDKRVAQATVIRRHAIKAMIEGKHVIVMGDLNDEPGSGTLRRIRGFDQKVAELFEAGEVKGTAHSYVGEEAIAAAVGAVLGEEDYMASNQTRLNYAYGHLPPEESHGQLVEAPMAASLESGTY